MLQDGLSVKKLLQEDGARLKESQKIILISDAIAVFMVFLKF